MNKKKPKITDNRILINKRARFEYTIEDTFEAGVTLQGWEVKSLRQRKGNITEAYVTVRNNELFLFGASILPLHTANSHLIADPQRTRKLLLHRKQINKLIGLSQRDGYTITVLDMHWKNQYVKATIGVAKGKNTVDKRTTVKDREWAISKQRIMKNKNL